jgi:hypothetical protein
MSAPFEILFIERRTLFSCRFINKLYAERYKIALNKTMKKAFIGL